MLLWNKGIAPKALILNGHRLIWSYMPWNDCLKGNQLLPLGRQSLPWLHIGVTWGALQTTDARSRPQRV